MRFRWNKNGFSLISLVTMSFTLNCVFPWEIILIRHSLLPHQIIAVSVPDLNVAISVSMLRFSNNLLMATTAQSDQIQSVNWSPKRKKLIIIILVTIDTLIKITWNHRAHNKFLVIRYSVRL